MKMSANDRGKEPEKATAEETIDDILQKGLIGKNVTIVTVGVAGVGKSTLVNTVMTEEVCKEGTSAKSVTTKMEKKVHQVPLKGGSASLTVYDSPGFTGKKEHDHSTAEGLWKTKEEANAILICFDLNAFSGRYMPGVHRTAMEKIVQVYGEAIVKKKGIIVLTKANLVSDQSKSTGVSATELVKEWTTEYKLDQKKLADLPVVAAGRAHFSVGHDITHISEVDGKVEWLNDLWNGVASLPAIKGSALAPLMAVICQRQREKLRERAQATTSDDHEGASEFSGWTGRPMQVADFPVPNPLVIDRLMAFLHEYASGVLATIAALAVGTPVAAAGGSAAATLVGAGIGAMGGLAVARAVKSWYEKYRKSQHERFMEHEKNRKSKSK